ncbi:MAG TPA: hypothetical protein VER03_24140 [Bryobacteraceae bacterium]|nr:hypothetical protein [Bryobacteraceae bacterium]
MTRQDLQELAEMRLADAEALLVAGRYSGAYYLAGYAVECAIKAHVSRSSSASMSSQTCQGYARSIPTDMRPLSKGG